MMLIIIVCIIVVVTTNATAYAAAAATTGQNLLFSFYCEHLTLNWGLEHEKQFVCVRPTKRRELLLYCVLRFTFCDLRLRCNAFQFYFVSRAYWLCQTE